MLQQQADNEDSYRDRGDASISRISAAFSVPHLGVRGWSDGLTAVISCFPVLKLPGVAQQCTSSTPPPISRNCRHIDNLDLHSNGGGKNCTLTKMFTLLSSKEWFYSSNVSGQQSHDLRSWPFWTIHLERLFCLSNLQISVVLATLYTMTYITLFMPGCFVLRVMAIQRTTLLLLILLHRFIFL